MALILGTLLERSRIYVVLILIRKNGILRIFAHFAVLIFLLGEAVIPFMILLGCICKVNMMIVVSKIVAIDAHRLHVIFYRVC